MTPAIEAILLPVLFLTVTLLAGVHAGAALSFAAPSPFALILAALLLAALVRSGACAPARLLDARRTALENANGLVVLLTLFAAAAQLTDALLPVSGLPWLFGGVLLFALLLNTVVSWPDRVHLLRSLMVTFGAAFLLKFVVLEGLSDPGAGRVHRVLLALMDAATLGSVVQEPSPRADAYLAFAAIVTMVTGLALLPHAPATGQRALVRTGERDA